MDAQKVKPEQRRLLLAAVVLSSLLLAVSTSIAAEPPKSDQVIDGFLEACSEADWLDEGERKKVLEVVSSLRQDPLTRSGAIREALRETHAEFAAALDALSKDDTGGAISRLRTLAAAENPYLAAESVFSLAQAHIAEENYNEALPLLEGLVEKHAGHSLHVGEATFFRGVCELHSLERVKGIESFEEFLEQHPNAPPRMLAAAKRNLEVLEQLELGSIEDIHDHIEYSRRRLSLEDSGKKTQKVQDDVVAMLTSLIEEIEKQGGT